MRTRLHIIMIALISLGLTSCGSSQTTTQRQETALAIQEEVNNLDFTFKATYAYPTSFKAINLSPYYDVKVSPDTVTAYLPYYGRSYTAPMDPRDSGIQFTSTNFEYELKEGKKSGNWLLNIKVNERGNDITLYFDIWDNGTARLSVTDSRRSNISFAGNIEIDDEQ